MAQAIFISGAQHDKQLVYGANYMTYNEDDALVHLEDYREGKQRVKTAQEKVLERQIGNMNMNEQPTSTEGAGMRLDSNFINMLSSRVGKNGKRGSGFRINPAN